MVTGVGSGTGQAILTALNQIRDKVEVHASDFDVDAAGLYLVEKRHIIPKLEEESGMDKLLELIIENRFEMIFPGNEFDVVALAKKKAFLETSSDTIVMVSNIETIELTFDKWKTYRHLEFNGIAIPQTFLPENDLDLEFIESQMPLPWIIKPRIGTASKGVNLVHSLTEANLAITKTPGALIQEYMDSITYRNEKCYEFTCGIFKDKFGKIHGPIVAERILRNGTSWIVQIVFDSEVSEYVRKIASCIAFEGPMNVQLIKTRKGPKVLEINCRFSGTTGIRSYFGFNEPKMALESFLLEREIEPIKLTRGRVLRYIENIIQV